MIKMDEGLISTSYLCHILFHYFLFSNFRLPLFLSNLMTIPIKSHDSMTECRRLHLCSLLTYTFKRWFLTLFIISFITCGTLHELSVLENLISTSSRNSFGSDLEKGNIKSKLQKHKYNWHSHPHTHKPTHTNTVVILFGHYMYVGI